jgi:hypothetical protein
MSDLGAAARSVEMTEATAASSFSKNVVVLILVDIKSDSKWWGFGRYVFSRFSLRDVVGLQFFKMLGSGYEGGFGLRPSSSRQALFCVFVDRASADAFLYKSELVEKYKRHSREFFSVQLLPFSAKGTWAGQSLGIAAEVKQGCPVAALTRASIRPSKARQFWKKQPASERSLELAAGCLIATGVGEAPFFRQATFTVWESVAHMDAYARTGAHMEAIKASARGGFFSESMFVRFVPQGMSGVYKGKVFGSTPA